MKIVVIGGHLTPALSVIEEFPKDVEILYVGRKYSLEGDKAISLEYATITKKGISFYELKTGRLQRKITRHTIPSLTKVPFGFARSLRMLHRFRPDVVLGFGGYVSFPVILAAKSLKIPVVIHEQTLGAGSANKAVAKFASKICISFDSSSKFFPKEKTILTGNPVRKTILEPRSKFEISGKEPVIYITGGSQGSHALNSLVSATLSRLLDNYIVIHQTGDAQEFNDFGKLSILKEGLNNNKRTKYIVSKFFTPDEIGGILKASVLVVGRAGINSVSELIVLKKPALLIPLPYGQHNEQLTNAEFFKECGLGEVSIQKDLTPEVFITEIDKMIKKIDAYKLKGKEDKFPKDAAKKIIEVIYEVQPHSN